MYLGYNQIQVAGEVLTESDLTIPGRATGAVLQAETGSIRYTMDNSTVPNNTKGMLLVPTLPPEEFLIDDVRRIKFVRNGTTNAVLNIHYFGGRDI